MSRWLVLVPFFVACGGAGRADTILSLTGDETAGATIYDDNCAVCHGADGTGVTGPNLTGESVGTSVVDTVLDGKEDMPAFGSDLTDQDVADLLAWLDANVFG
ncbi:MAG TPA: cytochrome c [Myxococcota bacterium]|nr:cytochrome c [Myxococcota bacterium]